MLKIQTIYCNVIYLKKEMEKIQEELHKHAHANTRAHCLYGFYALGKKKSELATLFHKDKKTIGNWVKHYEITGNLNPSLRNTTHTKVTQNQRDWIIQLFKKKPVLFQREAARLFFVEFSQSISLSSIGRILREANMTRQVLERRAIQVSLIDIVRFTKELAEIPWMVHNLVFLDEISIDNTDMWRTRGYGVKGDRLYFRGEFSRKVRTSLLCFCDVEGMTNCYVTEGTFTREIFVNCLRSFILEKQNGVNVYPGRRSIFIMDGAKIHTDENITLYLRSLGLYVLFLPAYSPYFNPIEILFGIMKQHLKSSYVENTKQDPKVILGKVIKQLSKKNLSDIFRKCGYGENGIFNPGVGVSQDLDWYGFKRVA
uniref:CSON010010 protein n=1 Tax=Culicoides sonorensis TaxID=179676 RepID=A0A336LR40_CULSO